MHSLSDFTNKFHSSFSRACWQNLKFLCLWPLQDKLSKYNHPLFGSTVNTFTRTRLLSPLRVPVTCHQSLGLRARCQIDGLLLALVHRPAADCRRTLSANSLLPVLGHKNSNQDFQWNSIASRLNLAPPPRRQRSELASPKRCCSFCNALHVERR